MSIQTPTPEPIITRATRWLSPDDPLVQNLIHVIEALIILLVALVLARFLKRWVVRFLSRGRVSLNMAALLGNAAQASIVVLGIITALASFGVTLAGLVTVLGAAGLALSLSMQDLLKNVIAGVYLLIEQPFRIGDRITVKDVTGKVQGIELRTTVLTTEDGLQVVVPNGTVLNEIVTNRSVSNLQRQIIQVRTKQTNLNAAIRGIGEVLKATGEIAATPSPVVALEEVADSTARLRVEFWVPTGTMVPATRDVVAALQARFPDAGVTVGAG